MSQPQSASHMAGPADLPGCAQVDKDLRQMLIKSDAPPAQKIGVRVWPKAIPQFNVGHLEVVQVELLLADLSHSAPQDCRSV